MTNRQNILILGHNDATQFVDIYNQYTQLFDRKRFCVTVAYLTGPFSADTQKRTIAENVIFLEQTKQSVRALKIKAIKKLVNLTRQYQFQMVICHRYKPSYIMMWVAQFQKIPAIVYVLHELKSLSSWGRRLLIATLMRKNMIFAGVSNAVRDDLQKHLFYLPKSKITTLYNAIDVFDTENKLLTKEAARLALKLPEDAFIFGQVARLVPNKDQHSLIKAFSSLKKNCPRAKLIIMGDGPLLATLENEVLKYQLTNDVIFTGFIANAFSYMRAFDCFILSSTQEAFGRVLLEAMIAKRPIIATRVNGIPEVMGNQGILVDPKDINGLTQAMETIYHYSEAKRQACGDQLYQHAISHYTISVFHQQFWSLPLMQSFNKALATKHV